MKLPGTPLDHIWFYFTMMIITILVFVFGFGLLEKGPQIETGTVEISFKKALKIERNWIDKVFPQLDYLLAPVSPLPCIKIKGIARAIRQKTQKALDFENAGDFQRAKQILSGSKHWLPVLTLVILSAKHNKEQDALQFLEKYLKANWKKLKNSKQRTTRSALIHLGYMYGWLRIKTGRYFGNYDLLWGSLKRPIGVSTFFIERPTTRNQSIPKPGGCSGAHKLTSYALYNNLIVAYMKTKNFNATRQERNRECRRSATWRESQTFEEKPLLFVMKKLCPSNNIEEYWIWALTNAESLFKQELEPQDSLLNINLMLLIDSIIQRGDQTVEVQKALSQKRELLRRLSLKNWASAPKEYKSIVAPSLVRLANNLNEIPTDIDSYLNEEQAEVIEAIRFTTDIREGDYSIQWLTKRRDEIKEKLGIRADDWINAIKLPPEIVIVKLWNGLSDYKWIMMIISLLVIFLWGYWRAGRAKERKILFTSFYKIEADEKNR